MYQRGLVMYQKGKRILCCLLTIAMLASLAACGAQPQQQAPTAQSQSGDESQIGMAESAESTSNQYFDTDGNMILPLVSEPVKYNVMWRKDPMDKGTIMDKAILANAFEATGITWEVEDVSNTGWDEKVSVVFASNDLPDVFAGEIRNLINFTDQCLDITDMLSDYAPTFAKFLYEEYPAAARAEAFDGRLYSLPSIRVNNLYPDNFWMINQKWLDNVGMDVPKTTDELYDVLKAFKDQDANGNGDPNDELPISFVKNNDMIRSVLSMMSCFGLVNDGTNKMYHYIMVENGEVFFTPTDQRFYDMLAYMNKLYSEGLIDRDSFVQEKTDRYAKGSANRIGFMSGGGLLTEDFGGEAHANDIIYIQPPASSYGAVMKQNDPPAEMGLHAFTITQKCEQPELLLMMAEYCNNTPEKRFQTRFGPEGAAWEVGSSGKFINTTDFTGKVYTNRSEAVATTAPSGRFPCIIYYAEESQREYLGFSELYNTAKETIYGPDGGVAYKECFPLGSDTLENTAKRSEMFAEIDTYMQNFVAESIMNGISESKWESHKKTCERLNIEQFVADYQRLYEKLMN